VGKKFKMLRQEEGKTQKTRGPLTRKATSFGRKRGEKEASLHSMANPEERRNRQIAEPRRVRFGEKTRSCSQGEEARGSRRESKKKQLQFDQKKKIGKRISKKEKVLRGKERSGGDHAPRIHQREENKGRVGGIHSVIRGNVHGKGKTKKG